MLAAEELLVNDIDQLKQMVLDRKEGDRVKVPDKQDKSMASGGVSGSRAADTAAAMQEDELEVSPSSVLTLNGHESEVYICAWSPTEPLLASGCAHADRRMVMHEAE